MLASVGGETGKGQAGDLSPSCSRASRTIIRSRNDSPFGEKCSYTYVRVQSTEIVSSRGVCKINKCVQWWEGYCIGKWKKNKRLTSNDMLAFPRYTLWQFTLGHMCCLLSPWCNELADSLWWEARYNSCWFFSYSLLTQYHLHNWKHGSSSCTKHTGHWSSFCLQASPLLGGSVSPAPPLLRVNATEEQRVQLSVPIVIKGLRCP